MELTLSPRRLFAGPPTGVRAERGIPFRIWRIPDQLPVVVRRAVAPPHGTTFAECSLRVIDPGTNSGQCLRIVPDAADGPARRHQLVHKALALLRLEFRIAQAPQPTADHEIPAIGRSRIRGACSRTAHRSPRSPAWESSLAGTGRSCPKGLGVRPSRPSITPSRPEVRRRPARYAVAARGEASRSPDPCAGSSEWLASAGPCR